MITTEMEEDFAIKEKLAKIKLINDEREANQTIIDDLVAHEKKDLLLYLLRSPSESPDITKRNVRLPHPLSEDLRKLAIEYYKARQQELLQNAMQLMK